ncbi:MAG TPA: glycosyltransferase family 4 protein [Anaerolineales bacterium]|nr:glycosyltransferase family 4 protein [Anaerolineales bacterium]HRQ93319.1 glycosyltransferase family 4 protein [Anaerolineales bacterium]
MRILFVADGRSPITQQWLHYFIEQKHEVHLASTFACEPQAGLASWQHTPVAYSGAVTGETNTAASGLRSLLPTGLRTTLRNLAGPLTLPRAASGLESVINQVKPQLVHALRIPYEGMLAAAALEGSQLPLLLSVWGNDFTLHARSTPLIAAATRRALRRANGLLADTQRDLRLAQQWSLPANTPTMAVPGNGGVRSDIFHPAKQPAPKPHLINPRGLRAYVRNEVFFKAIALVVQQVPDLHVECPAMHGEPQAEAWVRQHNLQSHVTLLPKLAPAELAEAYRRAQLMVSPSTHDGTPNTLLEAMACGLLPVAGDLDSIREWVMPGENGLLVDPNNAAALAAAILRGLNDAGLRSHAAAYNTTLIAERADYYSGMRRAEAFYQATAGVAGTLGR